MSQTYDPYRLASPRSIWSKIVIFLVLVALVAAILATQPTIFFWANPFINSLISADPFHRHHPELRQVIRLFPEINWVNALQEGRMPSPPSRGSSLRWPTCCATALGEAVITPSRRCARSSIPSATASIESQGHLALPDRPPGLSRPARHLLRPARNRDPRRLDHPGAGRHGGRYAQRYSRTSRKASPRCSGGMGTAFSASLLGLSGSLILGFLDLQASQAQNAFCTIDLETG